MDCHCQLSSNFESKWSEWSKHHFSLSWNMKPFKCVRIQIGSYLKIILASAFIDCIFIFFQFYLLYENQLRTRSNLNRIQTVWYRYAHIFFIQNTFNQLESHLLNIHRTNILYRNLLFKFTKNKIKVRSFQVGSLEWNSQTTKVIIRNIPQLIEMFTVCSWENYNSKIFEVRNVIKKVRITFHICR